MEFGNARFQALADRYVTGGDVSPKALSPVWRDTVGAAPDGVVDEAAGRFFAAVRRLNQTLIDEARGTNARSVSPAYTTRVHALDL